MEVRVAQVGDGEEDETSLGMEKREEAGGAAERPGWHPFAIAA